MKYRHSLTVGLDWLIKKPFRKAKCDLYGHDIDPKAEDALFDDDKVSVETICKRCDAPLILELQDDDTYIVKERLE